MTKEQILDTITALALKAGFHGFDDYYNEFGPTIAIPLEKFAALHRAAILEELTGEMPEPAYSGAFILPNYKLPHVYTEQQMREYAAGLVAKAVAAERGQCAELCEHLSARACDAGDCADAIRELK